MPGQVNCMRQDISMNSRAEPDHDAWDAWHPLELGNRLAGVSKPWCIVGGWALDLWHGHQTRDHDDLEFTILRDDLNVFRQVLHGMDFYTAGSGIVEFLPPDTEPPSAIWQIWCQDEAEKSWRVDMMIEPGTLQTWVYKRDPRISRPRADMVRMTLDGLSYLGPAGVLLFKAKHQRPKDEIDFRNALPKLAAPERAWLRACLEMVHPEHDWIKML
ncbi:amino acid transporter [Pararhizobium sp. BT-229]|uniref:nucleotidyltransferase domain-containing protein n=1 Tax=Pararhizobium sp. BT-229 TaxID=2986923 RepID=UPI0021F7E3EF|nr:amino acid transporter [Pararhizobium sp. BT-229]MCV9966037.1 amino acid transporter [Pararhizobium sp. BT-229]